MAADPPRRPAAPPRRAPAPGPARAAPWQSAPCPPPGGAGAGGCAAPSRLPPRKVVINAFHDRPSAEAEDRRAPTNRLSGDGIPADFEGVARLVERYAREQPIDELEIACHGSGGDVADLAHDGFYGMGPMEGDNPQAHGRPGFYRRLSDLDIPGAMIVGTRIDVVSANSVRAHHRSIAERIGRAVLPGGRIVLQACFIALPNTPAATASMMSYSQAIRTMDSGAVDANLHAVRQIEEAQRLGREAINSNDPYSIWGGYVVDEMSRVAPHVTVTGAAGPTYTGRPGLQGMFEHRRVAANGEAINVPGQDPGTRMPVDTPPAAPPPPARPQTVPQSPMRRR